jgi:hypothetical protein
MFVSLMFVPHHPLVVWLCRRFLVDVGDIQARNKASQALREGQLRRTPML